MYQKFIIKSIIIKYIKNSFYFAYKALKIFESILIIIYNLIISNQYIIYPIKNKT